MGDRIVGLREVHSEPIEGSTVTTVALSDGSYGLQFVNKDGLKTRLVISAEGAEALVSNLTKVMRGEGSTPVHSVPKPTWRAVNDPGWKSTKKE
jgi:hypothetical protein